MKKGTQKTELIIGTAATKLAAAVANIKGAVETATQLEQQLTDYNLKVSDLEGKIAGLEQEYANKKQQAEIDLGLQFKAAKQNFAKSFLTENGMIAVVVEEDNKVKEELASLKKSFEDEVTKRVSAATNSIQSSVNNKIALLESEYKAKEAGNLAKIENLTAQLEFANQMAAKWEKQLNDEREASVKRASASAVNQTIQTTGK